MSGRNHVRDRDSGDGGVCAVETSRCPIQSLSRVRLILGPRTGLEQQAGSDCVRAAAAGLDIHLTVLVEEGNMVLLLLDSPSQDTAAAAVEVEVEVEEGRFAAVASVAVEHTANTAAAC